MIPSVISRDVQRGVKSFLETTYPSSTPLFARTLREFLDRPGQVFKGPYYSLRLPFRPAEEGRLPFERIQFPYRPHRHQAQAFSRLCGDLPQSTLIATGTGSGKTECFLYPILDACALRAGQPGIKAILIYPMNALATDQAKRVAEAIHKDERLRGKVTAGLFIGGESDHAVAMSPEWLITEKEHLREHPPDILLTNYKMLDYLLLRPSEQKLWRENAPETLRFLVVDELHTFDGAQSTDLACLIRRLKRRLRTPEHHLCTVGTSATLGSTSQSGALREYAGTIFAETFDKDSVIGEDVLTLADVVEGLLIRHHEIPDPSSPVMVEALSQKSPVLYMEASHRAWFDESPPTDFHEEAGRLSLGVSLREHSFFRNLITLAERSGRKVLSEEWLGHETAKMLGGNVNPADVVGVLETFLALCGHARYQDPKSGSTGPLLRIHAHLWIREMSRLVASVHKEPQMAFGADLRTEASRNHLPVLHCRECGTMGWGGTMRANSEKVSPDLGIFYPAFFDRQPSLRMLFPLGDAAGGDGQQEFGSKICGQCLTVNSIDASKCTSCGKEDRLIRVQLHSATSREGDRVVADAACPCCGSASGLTILGSRSASLTSVAFSQLYTSPFNAHKKSLAFSDNVQDASHRAGFFAARTFRTNLRTALVRAYRASPIPKTLQDLTVQFNQYWLKELSNEDYVGMFLAPDLEWMEDYEKLRDEGVLRPGTPLLEWVKRRIAWEIISEFGFGSRIGRTLEKGGVLIAFPDPTVVSRCVQQLGEVLREKAGGFEAARPEDLSQFVSGLIHRLKIYGGIFHQELDLYTNSGGETYQHNNLMHYLPDFRPFSRAPSFFYQGPTTLGRFERLVGTGTSSTWVQKWAQKSVPSVPGMEPGQAALVIEEAITLLKKLGLLDEREVKGCRVWGLLPSSLLLSTDVRLMKCLSCGHQITCAGSEREVWSGTPCLQQGCQGHYSEKPPIEDYFGDLYRSGDVVRIRGAEHTGLLERERREWLETRFMSVGKERRMTDPNLLSCTPTLEMGVDIGDLSNVVLCSVPPETANYVQRIGRAGRKEGVGFSLTIAEARPRDLYFFELPEDMITGEIRPPGIYLDAPAVLERQFTAFCMDRWSENPDAVLPPRLDAVLGTVKAVMDGKPPQGFPYDFFSFAQGNMDPLLEGFFALFSSDMLPESSQQIIRTFAGEQGGIIHNMLQRFTAVTSEREDLRSRQSGIGRAIRKNRDTQARDEALEKELKELLQARDGISGVIKQIGSRLTLNFLTDEGLLPNYAFPEEGVELRSIILKKKPAAGDDPERFHAETYEYIRPAASAIAELAPGNTFYVEGRRLKVDQVGLGNSQIETWHFCDNCNHMEPVTEGASKSSCPTCGSTNWPDTSLRRELVRLRQVLSTVADRGSRSLDDKDARNSLFFKRHESVVIPAQAERIAYQVKDSVVPFGFEFLSKFTFRVVNLGEASSEIQPFRLSGREVSSAGFSLCPKCGKVQTRRNAAAEREMKHDLSCPSRGKSTEPLKAVFLYRELTSEAIRILLPSSSADQDVEMGSFVAALHLGLRLHFKGSIDHLKSVLDERPIEGTSLRRKYLVIYDQVPGGTGYLKQLSHDPSALMGVLRAARDHLQACECGNREDHMADGCHRCILQGRQAKDPSELSRTTAIRLLNSILEKSGDLVRVASVSDIDIDPLIQSELEKLFLASLRDVPGAALEKKIVKGRAGYLWRKDEAAWEIIPQVEIPAEHGVSVRSKPDFVFYPVRPLLSSPVAIFVDGYTYHADETNGRNRIAKDVEQRQALLHSGRFKVWSFSWEDISLRNNPDRIPVITLEEKYANGREKLAEQIADHSTLAFLSAAEKKSNWLLFLDFLAAPADPAWKFLSFLHVLGCVEQPESIDTRALAAAIEELPIVQAQSPSRIPGPTGPWRASYYSMEGCRGLWAIRSEDFAKKIPAGLFSCLVFDDETSALDPDFAKLWRGFLRLMNRIQFVEQSIIFTLRSYKQGTAGMAMERALDFLNFGEGLKVSSPKHPPLLSEQEADAIYADGRIQSLLVRVSQSSLPWPTLGFELEENGAVAAMAEAAWINSKVAIVLAEEDAELFRKQGWNTYILGSDQLSEDLQSEIIQFIQKT